MEAERSDLGTRIVVVGTSGSGKTTVARQLAAILCVTHVELDALNWEADWVGLNEHDPQEFRRRVEDAVGGEAWVVDGNYGIVRDLVWPKATAVVWLDYPLWIALWRIAKRTIPRIVTKEPLWKGNTESFRTQFLSHESLFLWAIKTHRRRHTTYPAVLARPEHAHLEVVRHRSPRETSVWLRRIAAGEDAGSRASGSRDAS